MFLYFYFVISSYYVVKPVRDSLFLEWMGADNLPYVYLADALVVGVVVFVYTRLTAYIEAYKLASWSIVFLISNLFIFRWIYAQHWPATSFIFYLWVDMFSIMLVTQFWTCANDIFKKDEAKRLFGFIGTGGLLGGLTGGLVTSKTAVLFGTENLLYVSVFFLVICLVVMNISWRLHTDHYSLKAEIQNELAIARDPSRAFSKRTLMLIKSSKYIFCIVLLVAMTRCVATLIDYQFKDMIELVMPDKDLRTSALGVIYAISSGAPFLIQLLITPQILKRFGPAAALMLLPIGLVIGSAGLLIVPSLLMAAILKISDGSFRYSINQSAKEYLYMPVARAARYKLKPFIDMFVYRSAQAASAIIVLVLTRLLHLKTSAVGISAVLLIGVWFYLIKRIKVLHEKEVGSDDTSIPKSGPTDIQADTANVS